MVCLVYTSINETSWGRNASQELEAETMVESAWWLIHKLMLPLLQLRTTCPGNGASHSGLGPLQQPPANISTGQSNVGNSSIEPLFSVNSRLPQVESESELRES